MQRIIIEFDGGGEDVHLTVPSSTQAQAQMPSSQQMAAAGASGALDAGAAPSVTGAGLQPGAAMAPMGADMGMLTPAAGGGDMFDAGEAPQSE
jgi:hypothetical protein